MKREDLEMNAQRLGIDISNMEWNDAVSIVSKALREEDEARELEEKNEIKRLREELKKERTLRKNLEVKHEGRAPGRAPNAEEIKQQVVIAPEIKAGNKNLPHYAYEEELGNDIDYDEAEMDLRTFHEMRNEDTWGANYKVRGKKHNKVVATTSGPRSNPGIILDYKHMFPVAHQQGVQPGYIWASPVHYDVKDLIEDMNAGVYIEEWRARINKNQYYIGPHICLPIPFVHAMMRDIERKEKVRAKEEGAYE